MIYEKMKVFGKQEIEWLGGILFIQVLQLFSGLEFCCGNDDMGWMFLGKQNDQSFVVGYVDDFLGMCFCMVYDVGFYIDYILFGILKRDIQIWYMVFWVCLIVDR